MTDQHDYWHNFYVSHAGGAVPDEPSAFARWVQEQLPDGEAIVEIGFGNARDSFWFARQGRRIMAFDFAESAVDIAGARAGNLDATFGTLDLYDAGDVATVARQMRQEIAPIAIYGRFLIHALEDRGRHHLLDLAAATLSGEGNLYLEFRTGQDRDTEHVFGEDHYRQYIDPGDVVSELEERGAQVVHLSAGHGLAVYKTEDPHVARIVARWS